MKQSNALTIFSQLFAGAGMGILMGIILGLSASPVVQSVLGTLTGLIGVFLGLQDGIINKNKQVTPNIIASCLRSGSFGIFCVLGIISGIHLRANDALGPTNSELVQKWIDAGYDSTYAKELALYQKLGFAPDKHKEEIAADTTNKIVKGGSASSFMFTGDHFSHRSELLQVNNDLPSTLNNLKHSDFEPIMKMAEFVSKELQEPAQLPLLTAIYMLSKDLGTDESFSKELSDALISFESFSSSTLLDSNQNLSVINRIMNDQLDNSKAETLTQLIKTSLFQPLPDEN